jgi:hypothetical protein
MPVEAACFRFVPIVSRGKGPPAESYSLGSRLPRYPMSAFAAQLLPKINMEPSLRALETRRGKNSSFVRSFVRVVRQPRAAAALLTA